jgi:hopanoid biosynthesis associated protein HpnK
VSGRRLIVTADDFGLAVPVNEAVEQAHRFGILSAASLMVTGLAAKDAVARARRLPKLGVGLHLTLVDGRPALPPEAVSELVAADGRFLADPWRVGVKIYCSAKARRQAEAEIRAQLLAFWRTGLTLDHVNGHHHFHLHPTVQEILLKLAPEFDIRAIRVPREPPLLAWRATGQGLMRRLGTWLFQARMTARMKNRLRAAGIETNDWLLGLGDTGHMRVERLRGYLAHLPDGISELYFHPAVERWAGHGAWPSGYESRGEFEALTDPDVMALTRGSGIEPVCFARLGERAA